MFYINTFCRFLLLSMLVSNVLENFRPIYLRFLFLSHTFSMLRSDNVDNDDDDDGDEFCC